MAFCLIIAVSSLCRARGPLEIAKGDRVLVGSSERNSTAGGQGQWCTVLETKVSGALSLFLYRITPVTLPHIKPVQLNAEVKNLVVGQNLTVVGYSDNITQAGDSLMEEAVQMADPAVCNGMINDFFAGGTADTILHRHPAGGSVRWCVACGSHSLITLGVAESTVDDGAPHR